MSEDNSYYHFPAYSHDIIPFSGILKFDKHTEVDDMRSSNTLPAINGRQLKSVIIIPIFLFGIFVFLSGNCKADDTKNGAEIEYGYPDQSIFISTINEQGHPDTPMTLVAEKLMTQAGLSWHAMPYPARRLFENLKNGTTNFSILVKASSLTDNCIFSKEPIYSTSLNVYHIGDKPSVKSKKDLIGKSIITIRGYSYAGLLKFISNPANRITNEVAGTHKAAFEMLKDRRADYLIDYASAAGDILSKRPIKDLNSNKLDQLDIFLVISKSYPDAGSLMTRLEKIVRTLDINNIIKQKTNRN